MPRRGVVGVRRHISSIEAENLRLEEGGGAWIRIRHQTGRPTDLPRMRPNGLRTSPCCSGRARCQVRRRESNPSTEAPRSHRIKMRGSPARRRERQREKRRRESPLTGMSVRLARSNGTGKEKDCRCRCRRQLRASAAIAEPVAG